MGLNYSLLIYGERRCYLALRSLGTFLMRENTYLFFNVFYFVLGKHTHTHTHEIFIGVLHIFGFIIINVIVQVFCCIILFIAKSHLWNAYSY